MNAPDQAPPPKKILMIITALRAVLAILLGVALIFQPDKTRPMLLNFIGLFWLMTGLMSLRWGARNQHQRRRAMVVGIVNVLAGLLVLSRNFTRGVVDDVFAIVLLGGVMILTGLVHVWEGIPNVHEGRRQRSRVSLLLGIFELVLGGVLLYTPFGATAIVYGLAASWAVLSGLVLIGEVMTMWRLHRKHRAGQQP